MPPHGLLAKAQSQPRNQIRWKYGEAIPLTDSVATRELAGAIARIERAVRVLYEVEKQRIEDSAGAETWECQSAFNLDPRSACKIDPPERHVRGTVEVVPVANRGDPRGFA